MRGRLACKRTPALPQATSDPGPSIAASLRSRVPHQQLLAATIAGAYLPAPGPRATRSPKPRAAREPSTSSPQTRPLCGRLRCPCWADGEASSLGPAWRSASLGWPSSRAAAAPGANFAAGNLGAESAFIFPEEGGERVGVRWSRAGRTGTALGLCLASAKTMISGQV